MSRPRLIGSAFTHRSPTSSDRATRSLVRQRPPRAIARRLQVAERSVAGWTVFTLTPPEPLLPIDTAGGHLLYLHGPADAPHAHVVHWALLARLAERTGRTVTVPIHLGSTSADATLALPAQLLGIYDELVASTAGDTSAIAVMGDGAGTELAIELVRSTTGDDGSSPQLILLSDDDRLDAADLATSAVVAAHHHDDLLTGRRFGAAGRGLAVAALASSLGEAVAAF